VCVLLGAGDAKSPRRPKDDLTVRGGETHAAYDSLTVFGMTSHPALPALRHASTSATGLACRGLEWGEGRGRGARGAAVTERSLPGTRPGLRLRWTPNLNKPPG